MEKRIIQFIQGLRAAGVRVSLAESQDAHFAVQATGAADKETFKSGLKATLIKAAEDGKIFDTLFPLYFGSDGPPFQRATDVLSREEMALLRAAFQALAGQFTELLHRLVEGVPPRDEDLDQATQRAGVPRGRRWTDQRRITLRTLKALGMEDLLEQVAVLLHALEQLGMSPNALERLARLLQQNVDALEERVARHAGAGIAERLSAHRPQRFDEALLDRPFQALSRHEAELLRNQAARLAARLRTRAALRQKRGKGAKLDAKATLRANLRHNGVPFRLIQKERRRKAQFSLICDVSTSMRPAVEFLLYLMYHIQDQVGRTRSFAFIDRIEEISDVFQTDRPEVAVPQVLRRLPAGHYNTDLGRSLAQFVEEHLDAVHGRTTLIVCGDGRNNANNPRVDLFQLLARRARRVVWFNPEPLHLWGTGDSDMPQYALNVSAVFQVANLRQLTKAVDALFS